MVLMGILGSVVVTAVMMTHQQFRVTDDEATGLSDTRVVVERLGRDIRGSRGVDAGATESSLVLWIDNNSDYIRSASAQPDEIVSGRSSTQGSGTRATTRCAQRPVGRSSASAHAWSPTFRSATRRNRDRCLPTPLSDAPMPQRSRGSSP